MRKKILFITPSLARTGSEMILWYLLTHIDRNKFEPFVYVFKKGELFEQLPDDIPRYLDYKANHNFLIKIFRGILKVFKIDHTSYQLGEIQKRIKADLWYVNTCTLSKPFASAQKANVKIVTHIHENLFGFTFLKNESFRQIVEKSTYLIGCSEIVCEHLRKMKSSQKVLLQNCFIDTSQIAFSVHKPKEIRRNLNIPDDHFVWVLSGTVQYMKGLEYLIELLYIFKDSKVSFVWVGQQLDDGLNYYLQQLALNSSNKLIFCGAQSKDYYSYLKMGDGFLMLSKAESFSLVVLEATYCGLPIVSFNVGIAQQIIREDTGLVIDDYNVEKIAEAMTLYHNGKEFNTDSSKLAVEPYTLSVQIPKFEKLLSEMIG